MWLFIKFTKLQIYVFLQDFQFKNIPLINPNASIFFHYKQSLIFGEAPPPRHCLFHTVQAPKPCSLCICSAQRSDVPISSVVNERHGIPQTFDVRRPSWGSHQKRSFSWKRPQSREPSEFSGPMAAVLYVLSYWAMHTQAGISPRGTPRRDSSRANEQRSNILATIQEKV